MSINNIKLPDITLQSLYKDSLIAKGKGKEPAKTENKSSFSVLGNNKKNIAVVIEDDETLYLPDSNFQFLTGILSACKLTIEDVAIINIKKNAEVDYISLSDKLHSSVILLFGVKPGQINLPLEFPKYQIQKYNGQTYLFAPTLDSLEKDKPEKTKLWNCLKQIFSIS